MKDAENYRIVSASFVTSVFSLEQLPADEVPEIAFVGRSNVGKSSLINALVRHKSLAQTSKTPGRTQSLNYFQVRYFPPERPDVEKQAHTAHFVDLPGYGFASVSKKMRSEWSETIEQFLLRRRQLCGLVLLIDCRREVESEESWIAGLGARGDVLVVLTKIDKLSKSELQKRVRTIKSQLDLLDDQLICVSTMPKKKRGLEEITHWCCALLHASRK